MGLRKPDLNAMPKSRHAKKVQRNAKVRSEEHTSELQSPDHHSFPTRRSSDLLIAGIMFRQSTGMNHLVHLIKKLWPDESFTLIATRYSLRATSYNGASKT